METKLVKNIVRKWAHQVAWCLSNILTYNKTHTMILVCADDDFRKFSENSENYQFLKIHKKSVINQMTNVWCVFSSRLGKFAITCTWI